MHKTLHNKLTANNVYEPTPAPAYANADMLAGLAYEMYMLRSVTNDLLQPRPEALANILNMARAL
jgi:hypothetical protein